MSGPNHNLQLSEAYSVLSDPGKRREYDLQRSSPTAGFNATSFRPTYASPSPGANTGSSSYHNATAAACRTERIRKFQTEANSYREENAKAWVEVKIVREALRRLEQEDALDTEKDNYEKSWWYWASTKMFKPAVDPDIAREERKKAAIDRHNVRRIRQFELERKEQHAATTNAQIQTIERMISVLQREELEEVRKAEKARREAAERAAARAREDQLADMRRRANAEAQAARERAREEEREATEIRQQWNYRAACHRPQQHMPSPHSSIYANTRWSNPLGADNKPSKVCRHPKWWPKLFGLHGCERCLHTQTRFAFQCPQCRVVACHDCMDEMKRGGAP